MGSLVFGQMADGGGPSAGTLVNRATSDLLIGPDWAMNLEICDILNHDPGQGRDVARALRKRLGSRNPKVQLLALTLLETVVKNCSDIVHMHIADKGLPQKMVKVAKKKPDVHVKEKILVLIDTWQEAFGGPQARHPQYFAAYQDLLRAGAVFPKRPANSAPLFTRPPTGPSSSNPSNLQDTELQEQVAESSDGHGLPPLSLADIQSAYGILEVLSEMLTALDPSNNEGIKQEVIVDLVEQCHSYKKRVQDLVNNTFMNEELLSRGLALNDDLERILAKHDSIAAGSTEKPKSLQALVDIDDSNGSYIQDTSASNQSSLEQLLLPAPSASDATSSALIDSSMDLLSGEGFGAAENQNALALVPVDQPLPSSKSEQNVVLLDLYSQTSSNSNLASSLEPNSVHPAPPTSTLTELQLQLRLSNQPAIYSNENFLHSEEPGNEQVSRSTLNQANALWRDHPAQGLNTQQHANLYGATDNDGALPPPPWEAQPVESNQQAGSQYTPSQNGHLDGMQNPQIPPSNQIGGHPQMSQTNQLTALQYQQMQASPLASMPQQPLPGSYSMLIPGAPNMHQHGQMLVYAYGQHQGMQLYDQITANSYASQNDISQRMCGLSMQDGEPYRNTNHSSQMISSSPYSYPSGKPSKPEDNLFGDLVSIARSKAK